MVSNKYESDLHILFYTFRLFQTEMLQCVAGVVEGVFPGWQWRPVNPGTRSERGEEWQPHNTTLPPCSEYSTIAPVVRCLV